jgi:hypothetical protein
LQASQQGTAGSKPSALAQALDIQGNVQLETGQAEQALTTWQKTEGMHRQLKDLSGVLHSQINQA